MNRMRKAYATRFRTLLRQLGARQLETGVGRLLAAGHRLSAAGQLPLVEAFVQVEARVQQQARRFTRAAQARAGAAPGQPGRRVETDPPRFFCDAGLGGLARWLRAAGYESFWNPALDDPELVSQVSASRGVLLTTDSLLMERRPCRDGLIAALWLPPVLGVDQQLAAVFREFELRLRVPRCMRCGGTFRRVDKASVWSRIPPRTRLWLDEYFLCEQCHQLFWHGTHWQRIVAELQRLPRSTGG
jgi:uncharacterized protein